MFDNRLLKWESKLPLKYFKILKFEPKILEVGNQI